jgi:ectoine hydroxylase-related dioxygenase (phytanoyl-CoA dioxygenase family)
MTHDELKAVYENNGYVFPVPVMAPEDMAGIRGRLEGYLATAEHDPKDDFLLQFKVHMVFAWAGDLIRHPAILDAVEALIGPDIMVWNTAVLMKKPHEPDFVTYHQDVLYWGNHPDHVVGAWLALSDSTVENGCVRVIPGSHKKGILPHVDTFGENNMLSRGQEITVDLDESRAVDMVLRPGEMSLHHTRTAHGSRPNLSDRARMGFVITYMAPATTMMGPRTGATLVRGVDRHGHFDLEDARPAADLDAAALAAHQAAMQPFSAAINVSAEQEGRLAPSRVAEHRPWGHEGSS